MTRFAPRVGQDLLTADAAAFVADLHRRFRDRHHELLARRQARHEEIRSTGRLGFLDATREVRDADWRVPAAPDDLLDRSVELTGPPLGRMTLNALRSGALVWMADFEDAMAPLWTNIVEGQRSVRDAVAGDLVDPADGPPTIVVRPRGWHLYEPNVVVDDEPVVAALVDAGLFVFHNAAALICRSSGPYLYLPKLEHHAEAALWHDVFAHMEDALDLPRPSIRASVLIETITAAFEMDEILFALGGYATALNAGRWDYLFSMIKRLHHLGADFVLPDRGSVTMTAPMMRAYTDLLVRTCHRRGAHAIGGMAASIPDRDDPEATTAALANVRADKEREAGDGFDGSWVGHPGLVTVCRSAFKAVLGDRPHQLDSPGRRAPIDADDLLDVRSTPGAVTSAGLRNDVAVALRYLESWLRGSGAVGIFGLMEDVATAEIARSQVWQWRRHRVRLADSGEPVTTDLVRDLVDGELAAISADVGPGAFDAGRWAEARALFERIALDDTLTEFLTLAVAS